MRYLEFFFNAGRHAELPDLKELTSEQLDRMRGPVEPEPAPTIAGYVLLLTVIGLPLTMLSVLYQMASTSLLCLWAGWGAIGLLCYSRIYSKNRTERLRRAVHAELYDREIR